MALIAHYLDPPGPDLLDRLRAQVGEGVIITTDARSGEAPPVNYQVLIGAHPRLEHLLAAPSLQTVVIPYAGLPEATRALLLGFPHLAVHAVKYNGAPTAELAVALLLAAAKNLLPADRAMRGGQWATTMPALTLADGTVLVLGHGSVGSRAAAAFAALGMRVVAVRRRLDGVPAQYETHTVDALPDLLPRADALIVCLPLTPATKGLLGPRELGLLRPSAVLVNVGRAQVVDEAALFQALRTGTLSAAACDVWYNEPTRLNDFAPVAPSRYPFHELGNVVMSPHRGYRGRTAELARMDVLARLLSAAARGDPMPGAIDVPAGY